MRAAQTDHLDGHDWGVRRVDGGVTVSSYEWARDVHELVGLPMVRWNGRRWDEVV